MPYETKCLSNNNTVYSCRRCGIKFNYIRGEDYVDSKNTREAFNAKDGYYQVTLPAAEFWQLKDGGAGYEVVENCLKCIKEGSPAITTYDPSKPDN